ncbi:hypothetical protein FGG08_005368 [Glutinoglossum americanum]|uniref:glucan 1,3-beta-glucosidase n=1 Tax=Glutinoglossum americanum TaxID=1670608 RepID=A0A9P8L1W4_9PEZI|nr:hypothetical protein FGG08_005368 [Glutinoglossum americanum]
MAPPRRESRRAEYQHKSQRHPATARDSRGRGDRSSGNGEKSSKGGSSLLSEELLAKLNAENEKADRSRRETRRPHRITKKPNQRHRGKRRVVSGPALEEGRKRRSSGKQRYSPRASAKGSELDPFTWYDTTDFNVTYTDATVGGLSVMGLASTWDDSKKPNDNVPALDQKFKYGTMPIRGVNIGGWLVLEPFITPSLFSSYDPKLGVVDEYTLSQHLGSTEAAKTIEKHYATFVTEETFSGIAAAGLDHIRIPYPYWAVTTYPEDPYVPKISWRYLLRGIEWARKYGLRVNLDLHSVPGSQNGWSHSGRQGSVGWINGTDGLLNVQRSLDIHNQLSQFFAQPRYKNIVTIYGLLNEPKMIALPIEPVLNWTQNAFNIVRKNGVQAYIAFGDGFLGLPNWQGKLQGLEGLVLDVHQYVIFNVDQIAYTHQNKIQFTCSGWGTQMTQSVNVATGFGPTLCGEWSQADTDCTRYLNNVNVGARWDGTLNTGDPRTQVLSPACPKGSGTCECSDANADPSKYSSEYKQWLRMFAEAQMVSFEKAWGWFYWNWDTEAAVQWSWKKGMAAGILPPRAYQRDFNCSAMVPDFAASGLPETY